jgi:PhnB protein
MTTSNVKPVEDGMHTVTAHLVVAGAADAIEWYKKAFGAEEIMRMPGPDGRLWHASIRIGDSMVMLADEFPDYGSVGPKALKGSPVTLHLSVDNVDEQFKRALDAGATVKMELADMFWGDRYAQVEDPFGHQWSMATHIRDVPPDEMMKAMQQACA